MSKNVSIIDVAKEAGVSTATVSHVINRTRFVSDETRKRVNDAIKELGYAPNASASFTKSVFLSRTVLENLLPKNRFCH